MAAKQGYCKEVNIKADLPTADLAVKRVGYNIQNGKVWGCAAIKIIHGYGSSGRGKSPGPHPGFYPRGILQHFR